MRVRGYGMLLLVWVGAAGALGWAAGNDDAELQLRFADGLMARGLHEHAIREYLVFQEQHPDYVAMDVIDFRVGEAYRRLGNLMASVRAYNAVIDARPRSDYRHRAMLRRADVYRQADRPDIAVRQFTALLEEPDIDPALADAARYWKARGLVAAGESAAAIEVWRTFLAADRDSHFTPFVVLDLGKQLAAGEAAAQDEAIALLRRVAEDPPDARHGAESLYHLARLYERQGDDTAAAGVFDDFFARYADDLRVREARLTAAWTYHRVGRYADSLRLCRETLADPSLDGDASIPHDQWWYLKANNQRQLQNLASAITAYDRLLDAWPDSDLVVAAKIEKAQSDFRLGNHERALQSVATLRRADAGRLPVLWLRATSHDALGNDENAIQDYRLIMEREPASDEAYEATYRLALLYQRRDELRQAAELFQRVAERYPDRSMAPRALLAAAELMRTMNRDAEAVRLLAMLLEGYPEDPLAEAALYRKAITETRLERHDIAIQTFQTFIDRFPAADRLAEAAFSQAMLYFAREEFAAAEAVLERALKTDPPAGLRNRIVFRRALALQQLQRDSESAALFKELLDDPRPDQFDPPLLEWLAVQLRREERPLDALRAADLLIERAGEIAAWRQVGLSLAGLSALEANDQAEAVRRLEAALALEAVTPYAAEAALTLGDLMLEDGRLDEARRRFRQADGYARDPAMGTLRARALFGLGQVFEAEDALTEANRYYALVGLSYDIPDLSGRALRKAAETFDRMNRPEDRDKMLDEYQARYPE